MDDKEQEKVDRIVREWGEAQKPKNQKKRNTRESFTLALLVLFLPIFCFWFLGWLTDISEFKEKWGLMGLIMFGLLIAWVSGYKYGAARGWAEIEVRMLPMEERIACGVYLNDDECIYRAEENNLSKVD